jgi:hypothetical protein
MIGILSVSFRVVPIADITNNYSIWSSARSRIDGGTARPSALAVLRLITTRICAMGAQQ